MATIYDVAKLAGTSISTVSNYLNQTKYVGPDKSSVSKKPLNLSVMSLTRQPKPLRLALAMRFMWSYQTLMTPLIVIHIPDLIKS